MKVHATVGLQSRNRGVLTWSFCETEDGRFCTKQNTGKTIWHDTLEEMRDSYRFLTTNYRYAQCCVIPMNS